MIVRKQISNKNIYNDSGELLGVRVKVCFENTETKEISAETKDCINDLCRTNPNEFQNKIKETIVFYKLESKAQERLIE